MHRTPSPLPWKDKVFRVIFVSWVPRSLNPKRDVDAFSRFCTGRPRDRVIDWQTSWSLIAIVRISCTRRSLIIIESFFCCFSVCQLRRSKSIANRIGFRTNVLGRRNTFYYSCIRKVPAVANETTTNIVFVMPERSSLRAVTWLFLDLQEVRK